MDHNRYQDSQLHSSMIMNAPKPKFAQLDGMVWISNSKINDFDRDHAWASSIIVREPVAIMPVPHIYLRKWAGGLYRKLSFKDQVKLRLDSTGVTKRSVNRTTGKTVVSDTEFASFEYLKVIRV